ncbi:MAG TPA: RimK/LysX family protein [Candidatus Saccharibacteria bacterium]|nr:RimK/LysX family protein [Candidatus Saccharibacteria bacterium]
MSKERIIYGCFEHVSLPELGIFNTLAKIDTGAYSGALHCSRIREYVRKSDGKKVLSFTPSEKNKHKIEATNYRKAYVRSSTGHRVKRYLFDTKIVIKNEEYQIRIGLSDRSDMNCEILIGKRFLRENNVIVDVCINQEFDTDGGKK